ACNQRLFRHSRVARESATGGGPASSETWWDRNFRPGIMTNDECQMTKEARMTNDEAVPRLSDLGIGVWSFFRHSSFVIRNFSGVHPAFPLAHFQPGPELRQC